MPLSEKKIPAKEALLEAARELFTERGYDSVSTREIADKAGVNLAAIQYHFGSKANLFVEVGKNFMQGSDCSQAGRKLEGASKSPREAGEKLSRFVEAMLRELLVTEGPQPCRLMFREVFAHQSGDSELLEALTSSVVNHFFKPVDDNLLEVLRRLAPEARQEELYLAGQSIIGQCSYYLTHGPFVSRLRGWDLTDEALLIDIARHITEFSMRGLGCGEELIDSVLRAVWNGAREKTRKAIRKERNV